jgi:hypothetical protein
MYCIELSIFSLSVISWLAEEESDDLLEDKRGTKSAGRTGSISDPAIPATVFIIVEAIIPVWYCTNSRLLSTCFHSAYRIAGVDEKNSSSVRW